jgi:hypothetical protein
MEAEDVRQNRVELLATLLLALAAVATAWSTYQGARWRGEQAAETGKATAARIESSEAATRAGQLTQIDIATFTQWVDATVAGNAELAGFYEQRFREEFQPAFDAWQASQPLTNPDAPLTTFALREYRLADADRATRLNRQAGARSDAARGQPGGGPLHAAGGAVRDGPVLRRHLGQAPGAAPARAAARAGRGDLPRHRHLGV